MSKFQIAAVDMKSLSEVRDPSIRDGFERRFPDAEGRIEDFDKGIV